MKIVFASNLSIHELQVVCLISSKERENKSFFLDHEELKCMLITEVFLFVFISPESCIFCDMRNSHKGKIC